MKADSRRRRRPSWLTLETIIIVGLSIKLTMTAFFLIHQPSSGISLLEPPPAMAQEAASPAETSSPNTGAQTGSTGGASTNQMLGVFQARETALNQREERLAEREKALGLLEQDLNDRLKEIDVKRQQLDELVKQQEKLNQEQKIQKNARIEHLVDAYKAMRPEQAGVLISSLDDDVAVQILAAMPGRNAGQILAAADPAKAARLTKAISILRNGQPPARKRPDTPTAPRKPGLPASRPDTDQIPGALRTPGIQNGPPDRCLTFVSN